MVGSKVIRVGNSKDVYEVVLDRTYTYIVGDSGTGKTYFTTCLKYYLIEENSDYFLDSDVDVEILSTKLDLINCDVQRDCVYVLDEDVCAFLRRKGNKDSKNAYTEFKRKLSMQAEAPLYPNAYFIFMTRRRLIDVNTDVMAIYEFATSCENGVCVKRLKNYFAWDYSATPINVNLVLVEGTGSDYLFFKNSMIDCDVIPCEGKNMVADVLKLAMERGYKSIFVFADGASYGYNLLLNIKLFREVVENYKSIRLFFPDSFEWLVLKSGLFKIDEDILLHPEDYFDSKDYSGTESFFTEQLEYVVLDEKNKNYDFEAISPKGHPYIPNRIIYSKSGSKSGYNRFVDVVLLGKIGIDLMYSTIREVKNYTNEVPMINNKKCKNFPITSERGKLLLEDIEEYKRKKRLKRLKKKGKINE